MDLNEIRGIKTSSPVPHTVKIVCSNKKSSNVFTYRRVLILGLGSRNYIIGYPPACVGPVTYYKKININNFKIITEKKIIFNLPRLSY